MHLDRAAYGLWLLVIIALAAAYALTFRAARRLALANYFAPSQTHRHP